MREASYTHYLSLYGSRTACGLKATGVVYSTRFWKLVTCPGCQASKKKK